MRDQRRGARISPSRRTWARRAVPSRAGTLHSANRMTILFWDIDGTLLTTGKAGVPAWEQAVREIVQRDFQLSSFRVAGLTDYQIAVRTFEMLDVPADDDTIRRMVRRYEELLPLELPK